MMYLCGPELGLQRTGIGGRADEHPLHRHIDWAREAATHPYSTGTAYITS
jgi:hypothetical protein